MKINYANEKVARQCSSLKAATKLFGGDKKMAASLIASAVKIVEIREVSAHYE